MAAAKAAAAAKVPSPQVANPKKSGKQQQRMKKQDAKQIRIVEGMTIKLMSEDMGVRIVDVIKTIIKLGEVCCGVVRSVAMLQCAHVHTCMRKFITRMHKYDLQIRSIYICIYIYMCIHYLHTYMYIRIYMYMYHYILM